MHKTTRITIAEAKPATSNRTAASTYLYLLPVALISEELLCQLLLKVFGITLLVQTVLHLLLDGLQVHMCRK
jgi:hypothetical protein